MLVMKSARLVILTLVVLFAVSGCKSQSALSAKELGCRTAEVEILDSEFSRAGSTTSWCAHCAGKTAVCVTNPRHDRIECRDVPPGPPCM